MAGNIFLAIAWAGLAMVHSTSALLSIPSAEDSQRSAAVAAMASQIANVDRQRTLDGVDYPLIQGPALVVPSLYYTKMTAQLKAISLFNNPNQKSIMDALSAAGPYNTVDSFKAGYTSLAKAGLIDIPQALDNSDEMFGEMRLGIKGQSLRLVKTNEWSDPLNTLSDALLREQCGSLSIGSAIQSHSVFVEDFSTVGQFTDPKTAALKYTPNVVGFFCSNAKRSLLLPLAIKIVDTGLTYTKKDLPGEWQLAKMALDSSEFNFRQAFHYVQAHLVSVPIQVELIRSMTDWHPVYALLDYHFFSNMALEYLGGIVLFSTGTAYDKTNAFGATGFLRSAFNELSKTSVLEDYPADIEKRGLKYLPRSRYVKYGGRYYKAIKAFVTSYLHAYYASPKDIRTDTELQTWASRCSKLRDVHDFPSSFTGFDDLTRIVTNFIFQDAVRHHFMNGRTSWHSQAAPFSPAALYNYPLPTKKGVTLNPLDYAIPSYLFPSLSYMVSGFYRQIPPSMSLLQAYTAFPFVDEQVLEDPIYEFRLAMQLMEAFVNLSEASEQYPMTHFKPSLLPWFSYI